MSRFLTSIVVVLCLSAPALSAADTLDHVHTVVLDPGHGGSNEGAVGVAAVYERFITLHTAFVLQNQLQDRFPDLEVVLTRRRDVDMGLSERTHLANVRGGDVLISLHYNAAVNPEAQGLEVFYLASEEPQPAPIELGSQLQEASGGTTASILADMEQSRLHRRSGELAVDLHRHLIRGTGAVDRGVRQAQFRVLRGAMMPAVVVELGFLTNPEEGMRVLEPEYTDRVVEALMDGLVDFDRRL